MERFFVAWLVFATAQGLANDACCDDSSLLQLTQSVPPIRFSMIETKKIITLTSRQMIALDTACMHHPGAQIDLYVQVGTKAGVHPEVERAMANAGCTVTTKIYDPLTFFQDTPFQPFADANMTKLVHGQYNRTMITDLVRMAALWRNGGWYIDTDVMVLRDLSELDNVAAYQKCHDAEVNGAVIQLEKHAPFVQHLANIMPEGFNVSDYECVGPRLVTRAWETYQGDDFTVLECMSFYPVSPGLPEMLLHKPMTRLAAEHWMRHSYAFHAWNQQNDNVPIEPTSLFMHTYRKHCKICSVLE